LLALQSHLPGGSGTSFCLAPNFYTFVWLMTLRGAYGPTKMAVQLMMRALVLPTPKLR